MKKDWLSAFHWNVTVATNQQPCVLDNALHRRTGDGYEITRALWESTHRQPFTPAGHIVAGIATAEEELAFAQVMTNLPTDEE